jgi:hypothetical protein
MGDEQSLIQTSLFDYNQLEKTTGDTLERLAHEITEVTNHAAIEVGKRYAEAQDLLADHDGGVFVLWLTSETPHSIKTAYNLINVYRQFGGFVNFTKLDIGDSAAYVLAAPSTPDRAREEAIERAESGERITHSRAQQIIEQYKPPINTNPNGQEFSFAIVEHGGDLQNGIATCQRCGQLYDGESIGHCPYCAYTQEQRVAYMRGEFNDKHSVHFSSETDQHFTPPEIITATIECLGAIDLDPCSNSKEAPNVEAANHLVKDDDGLAWPWFGRVYMNPPYGRTIIDWVDKLCEEHEAGNTTEAIALLPARPDTRWWARLRDYPACFITGRLRFGDSDNSAPFPSAVFYLGEHIDHFYHSFCGLGDVWQRIEPGMFGE